MLSVLIPAFNEEQTISCPRKFALGSVLKEVIVMTMDRKTGRRSWLRSLARTPDPVLPPVKEAEKRPPFNALDMATGEIIIVQDADLECDPAEIPDVVAPILAGGRRE